MTTLLLAGKRRCDARCHEARGKACVCVCDGHYHGARGQAGRLLAYDVQNGALSTAQYQAYRKARGRPKPKQIDLFEEGPR